MAALGGRGRSAGGIHHSGDDSCASEFDHIKDIPKATLSVLVAATSDIDILLAHANQRPNEFWSSSLLSTTSSCDRGAVLSYEPRLLSFISGGLWSC